MRPEHQQQQENALVLDLSSNRSPFQYNTTTTLATRTRRGRNGNFVLIPLVLSIPQSMIQLLVNRFGVPILELLYSLVKRTTTTTTMNGNLSSASGDDTLANYKLGLLVFMLYYTGLVTYKFHNAYRSNLTHLFDPFAPLRGTTVTTTTSATTIANYGDLSQTIKSLVSRAQQLINFS